MPADWYRWRDGELILNLCVQPRARRDAIRGLTGDCLKIQICAPPADGKANAYLCSYLAQLFNVSKSAVHLVSGQTSRRKRVAIQWPNPDLPEILTPYAKAAPELGNN